MSLQREQSVERSVEPPVVSLPNQPLLFDSNRDIITVVKHSPIFSISLSLLTMQQIANVGGRSMRHWGPIFSVGWERVGFVFA